MRVDLFHVIADEESAAVRRFLVENQLSDKVSFRNIAYESHQKALEDATGSQKVPCLIAEGSAPVTGSQAIIDWLKANRGRL